MSSESQHQEHSCTICGGLAAERKLPVVDGKPVGPAIWICYGCAEGEY